MTFVVVVFVKIVFLKTKQKTDSFGAVIKLLSSVPTTIQP